MSTTEEKEVVNNNEEAPTGGFKEESFEENPSPEEVAAVDIADTHGDIEEEKKHLQEAQEENKTNVLASSSSHQTTTSFINDNSATQKGYKQWYAAPTSIRWQNENSNSYHNESNEDEEWESLFVDLFYVPAISSLSELLSSIVADPVVDTKEEVVGEIAYYSMHDYFRNEALLCFFAVFFAIWSSWCHHDVIVTPWRACRG